MSALEEMPEALETEFSELDIDSNGLETRAVKSYDREIDSEQNSDRDGGSGHGNRSDQQDTSALKETPAELETESSELEIDGNGIETGAVKSYDREIDSEQNSDRDGGRDHDNGSDHDGGSDWYDSDEEDDQGSLKKSEIKVEDCRRYLESFVQNEKKDFANVFGLSKSLENEAAAAAKMANRLMTEEGCSDKEIAKELSLLTMYDLVMLIDDSASMFDEEDGKRRETLKRVLENICRIYKLARPEGIVSVKFLNCPQGRKNVKNADFLDNHPWNGVTRIGTELKKILDTFVFLKKMTKPLLIMVITDGGVEGERKDTLTGVISKCVTALERKKKGKHAVSFHFSKVGNDRAAEKFLRDLDNHSKVGEYVDCLQSRRLEEIDDKDMKWVLLPKLLLGAISEKWDDRDDKPGVGTDTGGNINSKPELEDIED